MGDSSLVTPEKFDSRKGVHRNREVFVHTETKFMYNFMIFLAQWFLYIFIKSCYNDVNDASLPTAAMFFFKSPRKIDAVGTRCHSRRYAIKTHSREFKMKCLQYFSYTAQLQLSSPIPSSEVRIQ
jgi:hypothetical protein